MFICHFHLISVFNPVDHSLLEILFSASCDSTYSWFIFCFPDCFLKFFCQSFSFKYWFSFWFYLLPTPLLLSYVSLSISIHSCGFSYHLGQDLVMTNHCSLISQHPPWSRETCETILLVGLGTHHAFHTSVPVHILFPLSDIPILPPLHSHPSWGDCLLLILQI